MTIEVTPGASMYRIQDNPGVWEHRGQVAAVGIGHAPTMRRWDWKPETSVGAWAILAMRRAIEDAGIRPDQVDGIVLATLTTTGSYWPSDKQIPQDVLDAFEQTADPLDGIAQLSGAWLLKNMPELTNVKFVMTTPTAGGCMNHAIPAAAQAIGDGLAHTCLVLKAWHNFEGRYYQGGPNSEPTVSGPAKYQNALAGPSCYSTAMQFQRYLHKYGKTHDMMAPYVVNSRKNGLLFPEGYWAQHNPEPLTEQDYNDARWISKPANLLDNDLPIHTAAAYVMTTAERAKDMAQKPVYVLGHAGTGRVIGEAFTGARTRGVIETLEEAEENAASLGRRLFESAAVTADDLSFENMYDGFSLFHVFHIEGIGYAGIKPGEALDFFQTDISIHGPHPVSPSGGNIGGGRGRFWHHTDTIQQIQGRAGARQIAKPAEVGISGGPMPFWSNFVVWSATPN